MKLLLRLVKKSAVAILAILYVFIAIGVVVNYHYCVGGCTSVDYGFSGNTDCGLCGMKEKKGCCHTDFKLVKLNGAHHPAASNMVFNQNEAAPCVYLEYGSLLVPGQTRRSIYYHSPPDPRIHSVYIHNSVFRI